jgi:hypothetical protein
MIGTRRSVFSGTGLSRFASTAFLKTAATQHCGIFTSVIFRKQISKQTGLCHEG